MLLRGRFVLWLGLVFLVGGVLALVNGVRIAVQEQTYRQRGEVVQATVTAKALHPATRDRSTSYDVALRFMDTDGRPLEGRLPIDAATWEPLGAGSLIAVQYVPGDPRSIRLAGRMRRDDVIILLSLGLTFSAVGGVLCVRHGRSLVRDWRIVRSGEPASATVTGTSPTSIRINRRTQWVVNYRYTDAGGRPHEGRSPYMSPETAQAWKSGSAVAIRFDRDRPDASVWMGGEPSPGPPQPSEAPAATPSDRLRRLAARYGFVVSLMVGGFVLAIAAEVVPVLRDLVAFVDRHWRPLVTVTAGAAAAGFVLFMGGIIHMVLTSGRPTGRRGRLETSVGEVKAAWRRRAWRDDARWRCTFMIIGGAFLMIFGGFSSIVLLTESFLRFMILLALAYAAIRTAWAFSRA